MHRCIVKSFLLTILLTALRAASAHAQEGVTITGRVATAGGAPVPSVTIAIDTLRVLTTSDVDGRYTLQIPAARVRNQSVAMVAKRIGYRPDTVRITLTPGAKEQNFTLAENPLRLGEMVVTGAGTLTDVQKLGNTVNSVSADVIARSSEQNVVAALAAKAPNIQVITSSGDPGASSFIRIRGPKTITGTGQPLFVVDGTPIDNSTRNPKVNDPFGGFTGGIGTPNRASDINPDDIESIEILKGAAAAAIYGARAGQGVVLITTKRGAPGATRYSIRTTLSTDDVTADYPLQSKYGLGTAFAPGGCTAVNCLIGTGAAVSFGPVITGDSFNHYDEIFERGSQLTNTLTISGGNDRTLFYISGSTFDNSGVIVGDNDSYQRYTIRLNAEHRVLDALSIGGNISYTDSRGQFVQKGSNTSGLLLGALRTPPDFNQFPYLDATTGMHRSFRFPNPSAESATNTRGYDNPFFTINEFQNVGTNNRTFGNVNLKWNALPWLNLIETVGVDFSQDDQQIGTPKGASVFPSGQIWRNSYNTTLVDHQLSGTANYTVSPDFAGTITVGHGITAKRFQQVWLEARTLLADKPFKLSNTLDRQPPVDEEERIHTQGFFGQATADLWNQLYLTAGLRYDGSSTLPEENRYNLFPKASVAWTFTDRIRNMGANFLSFAKLRGAYGEVGEVPEPYQLLSFFEAGESFLDGGWGPAITANQGGVAALFTSDIKGQDDIKAERTREVEFGVDLGFLDDRMDLGLTWYEAISRDVIFLLPLPPSSGFVEQAQNAAKISNRGWEVLFNVRPVMNDNLRWDFGLQWATNDNKVISLAQGVQFVDMDGGFTGNIGSAILGHRVSAQRGLDFLRCGAVNPAPEAPTTLDEYNTACAGAPRGALFIAADGFPVLDGTTRQIVDPQPQWTGSLNNSLRLGKFRVTALIDHQHGGQVWNGTKGALYFFGTHKDTELAREGPKTFGVDWMPGPTVGPGKDLPVSLVETGGTGFNWFAVNGGGFGAVPAQFVEDATFTKLREVSLSFSFDRPWVSRSLGLSSIDLRIAGRNLKTWTNYSGLDPETNVGGAEVPVQGVDFFNHPHTRSFLLSLTLNR